MKLFNKQQNLTDNKNVQQNQVENQESQKPEKKSFFSKVKIAFLIWNIISLAVYSAYSLYTAYNNTKSTVFSIVIIALLIAYAVAFVTLVFVGIHHKIQLKTDLKNYKASIKILKQIIKILNLSLSIATAVNVFATTGKFSIPTIIFGSLAIFITCVAISFEIFMIVLRKKKAIKKEQKLIAKQNKQ